MRRGLRISGAVFLMAVMAPAVVAAQPRGSYRASCFRIRQDGPILRAICRDVNGVGRPTRLDLRSCSNPPANSDGRLTC